MLTQLIQRITACRSRWWPTRLAGIFSPARVCPGGWLLASGLLSLLPGWIAAQQLPNPERITSQQGLPQAFIPAIVQDRQGFIWMATRDGLCRYDGERFKVFQPNPDGRPSLSFAGLADMKLDHRGRLWISSDRDELDLFDPKTETFTNVSRRSDFPKGQPNQGMTRFYVDRQDRLWMVFGYNDLVRVDLPTHRVHHFGRSVVDAFSGIDPRITDVIQDQQGIIWVSTLRGLARFDEATNRFHGLRHQPGNPNSLPEDSLGRLYVRPNGQLMISSPHHITLFNPQSGRFRRFAIPRSGSDWGNVHYASDSQGTVYFDQDNVLFRFTDSQGPLVVDYRTKTIELVASLLIDRSDVLWVGTDGTGIRKYDLRPNPFQAQVYQRNFHLDLLNPRWLGVPASQLPPPTAGEGLSSYLFRYTIDPAMNLWYNVGSSDIYRINLRTQKTAKVPFPIAFNGGTNINALSACPLATDPTGQVWAVYDSQIWYHPTRQQQWLPFPHRVHGLGSAKILSFVVDEQALWLITDVKGLWRLERATGKLRRYVHQPGNPRSLSNNTLFCISQDPQDANRLWLGTFGSGLCAFDKRSGNCRRVTIEDGLPDNVIYSVLPDKQGYLWMGTNKGLCRMNRRTFQTRTYTQTDGLQADEFNRFHWLHLPDDRIIMGGLEGITAFYPYQVGTDRFKPPVELTELQVNNQVIRPGLHSPLGNLPIQAVKAVTLPHDQNYVTAQFAALQFNRRNKNVYRYQLEGLDKDWIVTNRPVAVYTDLQPGHYTLRLNAANTVGIWSPHVRSLSITIQPPFWATWWAYLVYVVTIIGIVLGLVKSWVNRIKLQQSVILQRKEVELNQLEAQQLRANDELKNRFFANITHEFRTPLTLILGPAEQMMSEAPGTKNHRRLRTIEQNAQQLLRLINQLLDLSKLEAGVMPIHESVGELSDCIEEWLQPLVQQATAQGISLTFTSSVAGRYYFDVEKLERITYNVVANALKFTKQGHITVSLSALPAKPTGVDSANRSADAVNSPGVVSTEGVQLTVVDTGIGIEARHLPHLFERFYQVVSKDGSNPEGSGIGLALVNELVSLQGGHIRVDSQVGIGTTFLIELPYRRAPETKSTGSDGQPQRQDSSVGSWPDQPGVEPPLVLVVEDNEELAGFIAGSFSAQYRIRRATDGQDGWEQALETGPDLIISDVLMPRLDGFTLCARLKADPRTSHIPVMLLTAKVNVESRLQGLSQGADDYLTKPFQLAELQLRVRNQLASKQRLREWVRTTLTNPYSVPTPPAPDTTDPFLTRLYELMDAHLADPNFGGEDMIRELGMSRTQLFRKVKALTDLSAGDLLRQYRLKRATQYLREGLSVAQTAYRVGFDSPAYFSKCFREVYQLTPSEFATQV